MTANASIYIPKEKVDLSDLFAKVNTDGGLFRRPSYYDVQLNNDVVRFNVMEKSQVPAHIEGFLGYIASLDQGDERIADTSYAIKHTKIVLGLQTEKEFEENHAIWQSLFSIADKYDGYVFAYDSVLLPSGVVLVGPLLETDTFKINPKKVKNKNTKLLKKQGIDVIVHLPWRELKKQRNNSEIAKRCIVLASLLQLHFGAPKELISNYLRDNELLNFVTAEESRLLKVDHDNLEEQEKIDLYWVIESIWALTWVGKKHDNLTFNTGVESSLVDMLPNFPQEEPAKSFIDSFSSRSQAEVFEKLDKFYRAHWFARNNELYGKESPLVDLSIIMERRKALEWVSDNEKDWDEISLDT